MRSLKSLRGLVLTRQLAGLLWVLAILAACSVPDTEYFGKVPDDPDPTHLRWCNSGEPEYLDPAMVTSTTGLPLAYAMFDGLTMHDLDAQPQLSIATDFRADPDNRRFTFQLRRDARWSNGEPITSEDFAYHVIRVLHPTTGSRNAESHWKLRNAENFTANRVRRVMRETGPFRAGDIVELIGLDGEVAENLREVEFPDSNARISDEPLPLRDFGADASEAYATVPAGAQVIIVELRGADEEWAYVYYNAGDGVYGWVETARLTTIPRGDELVTARAVSRIRQPGVDLTEEERLAELAADPASRRTGKVAVRDLLLHPKVLGMHTPDPYTIVFETEGPLPYFYSLTADRTFRPAPREQVSRWPQRWTEPDKIVTSGPLHLVERHERDYMRMVKSKTWWNRDTVKIETFTSYNMNDQAASANYYFTANCDAITSNNVPSSYLPVLKGANRGGKKYADYESNPYFGTYFYMINTEKFPNVHLRRALSHATNREPIPDIIKGGQIPSAQFNPGVPIASLTAEELALCGVTRDTPGNAVIMYPGEMCYIPPMQPAFDPDKAREELAIAKKEMGKDFPRKLTIKFNTGVEGHKLIAEYIQAEWTRVLGIPVELESQEWKTFLKDTTAGEYQIGRLGWIGSIPEPEAMIELFKCDNPTNRSRYCTEEFDGLMKKIEQTADRKERLALTRQAEQLIADQVPVVVLYSYTQQHLQKPYVRDLAINRFDQVPLHRAWIDPDWKSKPRATRETE